MAAVLGLCACAGPGTARRDVPIRPPETTHDDARPASPPAMAGAPEPSKASSSAPGHARTAQTSAVEAEPLFRPAQPGARSYAANPSQACAPKRKACVVVPKDRLRAGILKDVSALAKRERRPPPKADARLDAAMNDLAHNLRGDDLPALEVVDFLLTHYGIAEPSPHLLLSRATAGADREVREQAGKEIAIVYKTDPVTRVGIGIDRAGGLMYVVVGLQESHLELEPVPRHLARGGSAPIGGKLVGRYREARVVVTSPDGKVAEQAPSSRAGHVEGKLACLADGKYQVEVTAEDKAGTAVLANFPVYCGVEPPAIAPRGAGTRQAKVSAETAERELLALVNRDRAAAGLAAVTWDARLATIARAHSRDMAEHDFVGHVSPRSGTALDRVHKGGLAPELVLENVGRAYSAQEVESGFMASPGHRANVVETRATKLGVGVVLGAPVTGTIPLYVTQILTN
ncbi:MAG TPA: CAP domain-containing protein [Polyangia bacterium]